jgi:hypothetical protein
MPYTRFEIAQPAERIGGSARTLRRWVLRGCDLDDPESVEKFLPESERKKTNVRKHLEARGLTAAPPKAQRTRTVRHPGASLPFGNGETLGPPGKRGAGAALRRLEERRNVHMRDYSWRSKAVTGL